MTDEKSEEKPLCIYCGKEVDTTKPGYAFGMRREGEPIPYWHPECKPKERPCPECGSEMRDVGRYLSEWQCPKCNYPSHMEEQVRP